MIFERALRRELFGMAAAVLTILLTVIVTMMLIRVLGRAADGQIGSGDVFALIGYLCLKYLANLLILTGFISVLMVVARTWRDSEMVVWFASGVGFAAWIQPVLRFALPLISLIAILSFELTPWAVRQSALLEAHYAKAADVSKLMPGRFQEAGSRTFFVESITPDLKHAQNIFVTSTQDGKTDLVVAKDGSIVVDEHGNKFAVLDKGRRYEGVVGTRAYQIMEFDRYGMLVGHEETAVAPDKAPNARDLPDLWKDPTHANMGELLWRITQPVMGLIMILMAVPLGYVNPRAGRSGNLVIALLLYVTYTNVVNVYQSAVEQGRIAMAWAWWQPHLFASIGVVLLFAWRMQLNSPWHPLALWSRFKRGFYGKRAA